VGSNCIKIVLIEIGFGNVHWTKLAQGRITWLSFMLVVLTLPVNRLSLLYIKLSPLTVFSYQPIKKFPVIKEHACSSP
jgi:hypothetical protein